MSTRRIAQLARVSATTVSLALRNNPKIPVATRRRVLTIAQQIGYRPDARVAELMTQLPRKRNPQDMACLGVISFYDHAHVWDARTHFPLIYAGMKARANELGYRLEPFWLHAPRMTPARLRSILDARGIRGLLCFGSPNFGEAWPAELDTYAVVTQGLSIRAPMHRVASHIHDGMWRALDAVQQRGYRRPGLILGAGVGPHNAHAYLCVYLGWCELRREEEPPVPVLRWPAAEEAPLMDWMQQHRPDVLLVAHETETLVELTRMLRRRRWRVPSELGLLALVPTLAGTNITGLQGNQQLVGARAAEMLVARMREHEFGLPTQPRLELVEMEWVEGNTLRPALR
ncbi:MAG: LacI family DNA-binding transcriptional regulator [Opitutae bacterium]|nr:LacI family DNA-binding transcriptional regulator [Opitutae bacterium]